MRLFRISFFSLSLVLATLGCTPSMKAASDTKVHDLSRSERLRSSAVTMTGTLTKTAYSNGPNVQQGMPISMQATYSGATSARIDFPLGTAVPGQIAGNSSITLNTTIMIAGSPAGTPATYHLVGTNGSTTKTLAQYTYTATA